MKNLKSLAGNYSNELIQSNFSSDNYMVVDKTRIKQSSSSIVNLLFLVRKSWKHPPWKDLGILFFGCKSWKRPWFPLEFLEMAEMIEAGG